MSDQVVSEARREQLTRWSREVIGPDVRLGSVRIMPGHGGSSLGFVVEGVDGERRGAFVIRFAPPGVRRNGNTDVLRQVPLLTKLMGSQIPVADVVWSSSNPGWFGTDVMIQELLAAKPLHMFDDAASIGGSPALIKDCLDRSIAALVALHDLDWRDLADWDAPRSIAHEVATWRRLLPKMPSPLWSKLGAQLADRLVEADPGGHHVGLFHGDFQTNNVLFEDDGRLTAVIDWELAGIGATGLDIGWLAIMADPACWGPPLRDRLRVTARPAWVRETYERHAGRRVDAFDWYVALACFRYGVIAGYNVRLHESGRRVDEFNASMADSVEVLLRRGLDLLN